MRPVQPRSVSSAMMSRRLATRSAMALARPRSARTSGLSAPGDRRLFDHAAVVARVQPVDELAHRQRIVDGAAQILSRPHLAGAQRERGLFQPGADQELLEGAFVLDVLRALAARHFVERRLGDVEMAALDQLRHLAEEEGEQQRADVGAVDVGVRHDDDLVIAQLVGVEFVLADRGAERGDQRADHLGAEHAVEARALDIEDLAAQRQDRLVLARAAALGRAAGAVALDDEDFGFRRVALLAVGQLAGQRGDVERALAR